jgi:hypothetical protein
MLDGQYVVNGQIHSDLYYIDKGDPTGPMPADPSTDPQYKNWEASTQAWVANNPQVFAQAGTEPQTTAATTTATTTQTQTPL